MRSTSFLYPCVFMATSLFLISNLSAQQKLKIQEIYDSAMKHYESGEYQEAAKRFKEIQKSKQYPKVTTGPLYNGACIFALSGDAEESLKILKHLAHQKFYSNLDHIRSDPDLKSLHKNKQWESVLAKVAENKKTLPERQRKTIKSELTKAKKLLQKDGGKLWGHMIWNDNILVLDFDSTIYSLKKLSGSTTDDGVLFYKKVPKDTLSFTNTVQKYDGIERAVVLTNYLDDNSSTIIHELYHVLQLNARKFRGDPIDYLDECESRTLLRLEYEALRKALNAANQGAEKKVIQAHITDAVTFRKARQSENKDSLQAELEIETLEGIANYTGYVLSTYENKYEKARNVINQWERSKSYTRTFPYATGPAYGILFDHLDIRWRSSLDTVYNFTKIWEQNVDATVAFDKKTLDAAKQRHNFDVIHQEELKRKLSHEKNIKYYTQLLLNQPTLRASVTGGRGSYSMSYDMNGTLVLGQHGTIYTSIKGTDSSGKNFGNFSTITGKTMLGKHGVLRRPKNGEFVFPYPTKVEGKKIVGENYKIELNEGWTVKKISEQGDLEIVREKKK